MMAAELPPPPPAIERLAPCPERPNCVSSLAAADAAHRVEPLPLVGQPEEALARLRRILEELPRSTILESDAGYLKVRFRSPVFRFADDLELAVDAAAGVVHVRSAARFGYSDFGVNRRRVEELRRRYAREPPGSRQSQRQRSSAAASSTSPSGRGPSTR